MTTLTSGQLCKTDGNVLICDSTTPTISASNVGIGTTSPQSALGVNGGVAIGSYAGIGTAASGNLIISGVVGIGTTVPTTGAVLDMGYTSTAMIVPKGATEPSPAVAGMVRYNTATSNFEGYDGTGWYDFGGALGTFDKGSVGAPGLAVTQDTTTGLFQAVTGTLSVTTEGTEAVRFLNTASAVDYLTLTGATTGDSPTLSAAGTDTNIGLELTTKGTGNITLAPASGNIIVSSGSVGIGTSAAGAPLYVYTGTNALASYIDGGTSGASFYVVTGGTGAYEPAGASGIRVNNGSPVFNAASNGILYFNRDSNADARFEDFGNDLMYISHTGGVALGTSGSGSIGLTSGTILDLGKANSSLLLPIGTTGVRPSGVNGMVRYNNGISPAVEAYVNSNWVSLLTGATALGSNVVLGTSATVPNPYASASDKQTGFYTAGAGKVDVTSQGTQVVEISTSGLNVVTGNVGIGTSIPTTGSVLDLGYTSTSMIMPKGATEPTPAYAGMVRYNTATSSFEGYDGTGWYDFGGATGTFDKGSVSAPGLAVTQDTTTGLFQAATGTLSVATEGTEAARFLNTAGAVNYLTIAGATTGNSPTLSAAGTDTNVGLKLTTKGSGNIMLAPASGNTVVTSGNLGVGTASPINTVDVYGGMAIGTSYAGTSVAPTNGLLVQGKMGIGLTSPGAYLEIASPSTNGVAPKLRLTDGAVGGNTWEIESGISSVSDGYFGIKNINNGFQALTIASITGNIGIGTTMPSNKLDVAAGVAIGTAYVGVTTAPTNGLVVQGAVGVGTSIPTTGSVLDLGYTSTSMIMPKGGTEPTPAYAGMVRYNTASNNFEGYDGTGWYDFGGATGTFDKGSVSAPGLAVTQDTTTGLFQAITGTLSVTTEGTEAARFLNTAGAVNYLTLTGATIGNSPILGAAGTDANVGLQLTTKGGGNITLAPTSGNTVVSAGSVGIGTANPASVLSVYSGGLAVGTYAATNSVGVGSAIFSGYVGIGTVNPIQAVQITKNTSYGAVGNEGQLGITGATNTNKRLNLGFDTTENYGFITSAIVGSSWNPLLLNPSGGNVSIGNQSVSPPDKLDIAGAIGITTTATAPTNGIYSPSANQLALTTAGTSAVSITSAGNVGIGTTAPSNKLDISGAVAIGTSYVGVTTAPSNGLLVQGNVGIGTATPGGTLDVWGGTYSQTTGDLVVNGNSVTVGRLSSTTGASTYFNVQNRLGNSMFFVNSTGVGVYNSSPADRLDVNGGIGITTTTGTVPALGLYSPSANQLTLTTAGTSAVSITSAGNVGIGTTSPASGVKADIAGPVKMAGTGSEPCTAAQVGTIRYNPNGNYFELCSYP